MKLRSLTLAALLICISLPTAFAAEGSLKIAVVNIQKIFAEYKGVLDMQDKIKEEFKADQEDLEKLLDETNKLIEALRNDRMIEPGSYAWFVKDQEIKRNKYRLDKDREALNKRLDERMVVVYKSFYEELRFAVEQYAKNSNYDLIIRVTNPELQGETAMDLRNEITLKTLHYYSPALDRTEQIIEVMNRIYEKKKKDRGY